MTFEFSKNPLDKVSADVILVFAFEGGKKQKFIPLSAFAEVDKLLSGSLSKAASLEQFKAKRGETLSVFTGDMFLCPKVVVLGLGKKEEFVENDLRRAIGSFTKSVSKKINSVLVVFPENRQLPGKISSAALAIGEGFLLGAYEFSKYKSKEDKEEKKLEAIIFGISSDTQKKEIAQGIELAKLYCAATIMARDLVNEQAAVATPTYLAKVAADIAKKDPKHIKCQILDREDAKKLGMEAFLGVARAAKTPPKFIYLEYVPDKPSKKEKLALVGKGITFDSGGINVKTEDHMKDMKMDMSGAAVVLSVFSVISDIKPKFSVVGIVAATPNLISAESIVPGDVVRAMNGKTIEVLNSDAEGRVTMADSLSFAVSKKATKIIDFATLTGACMVALGEDIAGLFSNNRQLLEQIKKAAEEAGEKVWEMPLEKDYKELNKSSVADISNIPSTRYGGAITAALFLQEFVKDTPWAHLDIAGPAFNSKGTDISPKGGTGHGVRTVLNLLK